MTQYLTVVAKMKAKPGKEAALRQGLEALVKPTRQEKGCVNYDLHQSTEDPSVFIFYENWVSDEALDAHFQAPHIEKMVKLAPELLTAPMELYRLKKIS